MPTFSRTRKFLSKPYFQLINVIGLIVPRRLRSGWRQEWEAELQHREALLSDWERLDWRTKLDLLRRSTGAFMDALWLQPQRWEERVHSLASRCLIVGGLSSAIVCSKNKAAVRFLPTAS
ncbi:MAG: hypothetical protein M3458_01520 [Acidobacteriota bacterium]|nr:hypothetical protein [Acidobacteriota bacterium]